MDYNFAQFLKDSRKQCKTKEDFIVKICNEIDLVQVEQSNSQFFPDRQSYLKRLEGAKFAAISSQFKEADKYNEEIMKLLERLVK